MTTTRTDSFEQDGLTALPVAIGATSPVPPGNKYTIIFSTTAGIPLYWNGGAWQPFNSAAMNILFGSAAAGNVVCDGTTVNAGMTLGGGNTYTLTQDLNAVNLTITSPGNINTNGYLVCVQGVLDVTAAPINAISCNGVAGGAASGIVAGVGGVGIVNTRSVGGMQSGGAGATPTSASGAVMPANVTSPIAAGGQGGSGVNGGSGTSGSGSSQTVPPAVTIQTIATPTHALQYSGTNILGGQGGVGGGSGYGDGVAAKGGAGGGGGSSGGVVAIFASTIKRAATPINGLFVANGAPGGAGGNAQTAASTKGAGGGSGGSGGGGGFVLVVYGALTGAANSTAIAVLSGGGGNGGNGTGNGTGGNGGWAGWPGYFCSYNYTTSAATTNRGYSGATGSYSSGTPGAAGAGWTSLFGAL